jgi:hypothetical protein
MIPHVSAGRVTGPRTVTITMYCAFHSKRNVWLARVRSLDLPPILRLLLPLRNMRFMRDANVRVASLAARAVLLLDQASGFGQWQAVDRDRQRTRPRRISNLRRLMTIKCVAAASTELLWGTGCDEIRR